MKVQTTPWPCRNLSWHLALESSYSTQHHVAEKAVKRFNSSITLSHRKSSNMGQIADSHTQCKDEDANFVSGLAVLKYFIGIFVCI